MLSQAFSLVLGRTAMTSGDSRACLPSENGPEVWRSGAGWSPECPGQASPACASHPPLLLPSVSQALQCYSFQHVYFGPFDLSAMKLANVSCPYGCSEAVLSLDTGEGQGSGKKKKNRGWGTRTRVRD